MAAILSVNTSISKMRSSLHGELIQPGDPQYETARRVWNAVIDRHPAFIIRCLDASDVQRAIEFGRQNNLDIAVRGGGHSFPGFSTCDGGLVIDLSLMKAITVNAPERSALAQPGLNLGELIDATQAHGLGTNTGTASDTGIAGLTLGGGIGWLMGKHGLTCDNVRAFELVTADGCLLRADAQENPDLYWALRGGGGNFGVATSFDYQLHPLGLILGGMIAYPMSKAREVLQFYSDFTRQSPDELLLGCGTLTPPGGQPVVGFLVCWSGDLSQGEQVIAPLRKFGQPLVDRVQAMPYAGLFAMLDPSVPAGRNYYVKGGSLPELSAGAIESVVDAAEGMTSPYSQIAILHFHGAASRVGVSETAFPMRDPHYEFMYQAAWQGDGAERHVQWARQTYQALQRFTSQRTYVNFLADEGKGRVRAAYGPNYERLAAIKTKYDPDNLFHLNQNIKPDSTGAQE
jgi:FAD/FMN-containing dehydrogenase